MSHTAFHDRTRRLIGQAGLDRLRRAHVLVVGLGGVGGHAAEALARAGVGRLTLVDFDVVVDTNLNRQIAATRENLGRPKTDAMAERIASIRSDDCCRTLSIRLSPERVPDLLDDLSSVDAIVDAIDDFPAKCALIAEGIRRGVAVFTSMGAGRRLDPSFVRIADIAETTVCPLARKLRKALKSVGIETGVKTGVVAVYSVETPIPPVDSDEDAATIGSIAHMPALFGYSLAGSVINRLVQPETQAKESAVDNPEGF